MMDAKNSPKPVPLWGLGLLSGAGVAALCLAMRKAAVVAGVVAMAVAAGGAGDVWASGTINARQEKGLPGSGSV
jgi:hypothetical protein